MPTVRHLGLFPFCVPTLNQVPPGPKDLDGSDGVGTFYPIGVDLRTALKWFWRVKQWRVKLTLDSDPVFGTVELVFPNNGIMSSNQIESLPNSELDLVCDYGTSVSNFDGGFDQYNIEMFYEYPQESEQIQYAPAPVIIVGEKYYPLLAFGGNIGVFTFSSWQYINGEGRSGGTATIDDREIDSFVFPEAITEENCEFEMSIDEYWGYDPGDGGGPIYDSKTGEELRDQP